jgi:hypothetical protein
MKVPFQNRQVEATPIDFLTRKEDFNEYQLSNGKIIKIKLVVAQISVLADEKDPEGNPVYYIRSTNVVAPVE